MITLRPFLFRTSFCEDLFCFRSAGQVCQLCLDNRRPGCRVRAPGPGAEPARRRARARCSPVPPAPGMLLTPGVASVAPRPGRGQRALPFACGGEGEQRGGRRGVREREALPLPPAGRDGRSLPRTASPSRRGQRRGALCGARCGPSPPSSRGFGSTRWVPPGSIRPTSPAPHLRCDERRPGG